MRSELRSAYFYDNPMIGRIGGHEGAVSGCDQGQFTTFNSTLSSPSIRSLVPKPRSLDREYLTRSSVRKRQIVDLSVTSTDRQSGTSAI